jgi:carbamoyltransferase
MLEVVQYWVSESDINNVSLAGGVFANVKLNQRIAEITSVENVNVFPNMGDGGISVGGVWSHLSKSNQLSKDALYQNMYLAPHAAEDSSISSTGLEIENFTNWSTHAINIAKEISEGKLVALHHGSMEFGPRALGNRSLILDARNREIINRANKRLNRTDFMPFAPIVLAERFEDYFFTTNKTLQPFNYMTMTCDVVPSAREEIPAVTHVDGTARPQIITAELNPFLYRVMVEYQLLTGCGVLVNTSLNMHEEPINCTLDDSVRALKLGGIDVIHTESCRITIPR